jgi:hypothetical protein
VRSARRQIVRILDGLAQRRHRPRRLPAHRPPRLSHPRAPTHTAPGSANAPRPNNQARSGPLGGSNGPTRDPHINNRPDRHPSTPTRRRTPTPGYLMNDRG